MYQVEFSKDRIPQILLGPFLNTLSHLFWVKAFATLLIDQSKGWNLFVNLFVTITNSVL